MILFNFFKFAVTSKLMSSIALVLLFVGCGREDNRGYVSESEISNGTHTAVSFLSETHNFPGFCIHSAKGGFDYWWNHTDQASTLPCIRSREGKLWVKKELANRFNRNVEFERKNKEACRVFQEIIEKADLALQNDVEVVDQEWPFYQRLADARSYGAKRVVMFPKYGRYLFPDDPESADVYGIYILAYNVYNVPPATGVLRYDGVKKCWVPK